MALSLPSALETLRKEVEAFIRDIVIPYEADTRRTAHGPSEALCRELHDHARRAGLLSPQVAAEWGGLSLSHLGRAVVFEAAGYSLLGPVALNCAAPDEGNMHLLEVVATEEQKRRFLAPLALAHTRSCFCMTEPHPGAGSDPSMLQTTATRDGDSFVISGRKWLITGACGAEFAIIMARTIIGGQDVGATMFLAPMDSPGIRVGRVLDTLDSSFVGGHAEVQFEGLRVADDAVLGGVGQGLQNAQVRLAPARLTHCMRWLGAARRAHDTAMENARRRSAFGQTIGSHEGIGFMLADNEIALHSARLMIRHTAGLLDAGERASLASSMTKVHCSEAFWNIADRCVQVLGGIGLTADTEVEKIFRELRAFRVYDGPSEVHRWSIARKLLDRKAVR
jgi:acyl-CoA dehydrogenase